MAKVAKKASRVKKSIKTSDNGSLFSASAILFAGAAIVFIGALQDFYNLKLVMVGFGSALLVVGGSLISVAAKTTKK